MPVNHTRRDVLRSAVASAAAAVIRPDHRTAAIADVRRQPQLIVAQTGAEAFVRLTQVSEGLWTANGLTVTVTVREDATSVQLAAPGTDILRLHLRWRGDMSATRLILG